MDKCCSAASWSMPDETTALWHALKLFPLTSLAPHDTLVIVF
jgi:hypothetical protein